MAGAAQHASSAPLPTLSEHSAQSDTLRNACPLPQATRRCGVARAVTAGAAGGSRSPAAAYVCLGQPRVRWRLKEYEYAARLVLLSTRITDALHAARCGRALGSIAHAAQRVRTSYQ
eukprot:1262413-Prymnesium_polylepis.1